jgi:hypothetical protein
MVWAGGHELILKLVSCVMLKQISRILAAGRKQSKETFVPARPLMYESTSCNA